MIESVEGVKNLDAILSVPGIGAVFIGNANDLRHTMATLLLEADVYPKKVQERLGHSKIAITMDTYSHVLPSMHQDVARKLDDLFKE